MRLYICPVVVAIVCSFIIYQRDFKESKQITRDVNFTYLSLSFIFGSLIVIGLVYYGGFPTKILLANTLAWLVLFVSIFAQRWIHGVIKQIKQRLKNREG